MSLCKITKKITNDYMFRAALQSNEKVLRGLVAALLGIEVRDIKECVVENPIVLGETIDDKTCVLDVLILLNNEKRLNVELQTTNYGDWPDRSLFYLSKAFNRLPKGASYAELKHTIHIGILDFSVDGEEPEFYAEYQMLNVKTHRIFNDKFVLRVLDLTQLENISEEVQDSELYYWAKLFVAQSWEEVNMLARQSESIREAEQTMRQLNEDERIAMQCAAREQIEHDMEQAYVHGQEEGREEGREEERINSIRMLIENGVSEEETKRLLKVSEDEFEKVKMDLNLKK